MPVGCASRQKGSNAATHSLQSLPCIPCVPRDHCRVARRGCGANVAAARSLEDFYAPLEHVPFKSKLHLSPKGRGEERGKQRIMISFYPLVVVKSDRLLATQAFLSAGKLSIQLSLPKVYMKAAGRLAG